jgi:hypothetical protein
MNVFTSAFSARSKVVEIGENKALSLHLPVGSAIYSVVGTLWITQEGTIKDFVVGPGERFDVRSHSHIVVTAVQGTGIAFLAPEGHAGPALVASTPEVLDALIARALQFRRREVARLMRLAVRRVKLSLKRLAFASSRTVRG